MDRRKIAAAGLALFVVAAPGLACAQYYGRQPDDDYHGPAIATPDWGREQEPRWDAPPREPPPTPYTSGGRCLYDGSCLGPNAAFPR